MLNYNNHQSSEKLPDNLSLAQFLLRSIKLLMLFGLLLQYTPSIATQSFRTLQIDDKPILSIDQDPHDNSSLKEKHKTLEHWHDLLVGIKNLMIKQRGVKQPKAFISYAWEDTYTEEEKIENSKLQRYLESLRNDLQAAGISVFLDIGNMHGNMKKCMEENLIASDVIITINTPRFKTRALAEPQTNLGFEYQLTLKKAEKIPYGIFPLHYKGSFDEAFGKWGDDKELKELKDYLIRDCRAVENYQSTLVATQRPLGIIPAIYHLDCDADLEYNALIANWRWSEFSSLPPLNRAFVGREEVLTKIALALKDNTMQAISGMGGIGKSEISTEYAHSHAGEYGAIRLLNAENSSIRLEFERMADLFGIDSKGMNAFELSSAIYKKIGSYKWLLIFDNADDYDSIKNYLPKQAYDYQHILITSRSQHWQNCLIIDHFTTEETYSYTKRILPDITKEEAIKMGQDVGYLPLALSQATAYIKDVGIGVDAYLKIYKKKGLDFLKQSAAKGEEQPYTNSVAQTIAISAEKLGAKSPTAARMLLICSYLDSDNIPLGLFKRKQLLKDREAIYEALIALRGYSLAEPANTQDSIQVNRLTQAAIRDKYEKQEGSKKILLLSEIGDALISYCPREKITDRDFKRARLLLPHMQSVLNHIESCTKTGEKKPSYIVLTETGLLSNIAKIFSDFGRYEETRDMLRKALTINENYYGKNHSEVAAVATNLGDALRNLGDYEGAKNLHIRALSINESFYGADSEEVAKSMENLGNIFYVLRNYEEAKTFYEKSMAIKEKRYPEEHPEIAKVIENLGNILVSAGDVRGANQLYERALAINQKAYSHNHPIVAISMSNLGDALFELGDYKQAKLLLQQALEINKKHYGYENPEVARTLISLSNVNEAMGNNDLALQEAIEAHKIMTGKGHHTVDLYAERVEKLKNIPLSKPIYADDLCKSSTIHGCGRSSNNKHNPINDDSEGYWDKYLMPLIRMIKSLIGL